MKITVLGAGGPFAPMSQGNCSTLIDHGDRRILIDCGTTVPYILRDEMGIPLESVTDIIITHCHANNIGGLEQLLFSNYWLHGRQDEDLPCLWVERAVSRQLDRALEPGMSFREGTSGTVDWMDMYVRREVYNLGTAAVYDLAGLPLRFFRTPHVEDMPCTSIQLGGLFVSGGTRRSMIPQAAALDASLIFHEAHMGNFYTGLVHTPIDDILRDARNWGILDRLWTCHHEPGEFSRALKKGQIFQI